MDSISGKVAVITGASSGIGKATAIALYKEGVKCIVTARRDDRLTGLLNEIDAIKITGDIAGPEMPSRLLQTALEKHNRCDIFINNAGTLHVGAIEDVDIDKLASMARVNVEAAYRSIYVFLKHFKKAGQGHIINISSVLGTKVRPTAGGYAGTKYAIEALSEALRMELTGTKIKVSCIEPGLVMTELHDEWETHPKEMMDIKEPLSADQIAEKVIYILNQPDHIRIPRLMIIPDDHNI